MIWIAPSEKDTANAALEKRLWDAADQFRANSGLKFQEYSAPVLGLIFLRFAEVRFAAQRAKLEKASASARRGSRVDISHAIVEYEPDSELRDFEQISLLEPGGIEAFIRREVLPYTPDAWLVEADTKIGYEVSFTRHFYQPPQLRTLAQISADILALEQETEGLLHEITKGATA